MKTGCFKKCFFCIIYFLCFLGCASVKPANTKIMEPENYGPIKEYFITTMTLYDEMQQPHAQSVEINEKEAFIELVRQILDNPDYKYSYAQNDLYYIAQLYNHFSLGVFTARDGSTYEQVNSSGTQATYRNTLTGQLMDIRTQLNEGRLGEFEKYYLDAGYFVAIETMDLSQLVLAKNFRDISHLATEIRIDDLLSYSSDNEAFWGIMDEIIGLDVASFTNQSFYDYLEPRLFAEEKQIGDFFKQYYSKELDIGEAVVITYLYKGQQKAMGFVYRPHHDVFTDKYLSQYDFVHALGRPSTWKYLTTEPKRPIAAVVPLAPAPPTTTPVLDNFVRINGGTFTMGSPSSEPGRYDNEGPQRQVTVSSFYMGRYEVTQKEYQEIMGKNPSHFKRDNLPVERVSWFDAVEYCNKRSQREGLTPAYTIKGTYVMWNQNANGYRLPTEAEWEYACRAGTTTAYNTGASINDNTGWYNVNSGRTTHPVGQKPSNHWGLYDMHGNVWEWCWDWYDASGYNRVIRGGSWRNSARDVRSVVRGIDGRPLRRLYVIGFRLAHN